MDLKELVYKTLSYLNSQGFPLPMLRDPKTGKGSVTLTMFWLAFNVAIFTLAGRITNLIGDVDYSNVLWLLALTGGLYLGRKMQAGKSSVSLEKD